MQTLGGYRNEYEGKRQFKPRQCKESRHFLYCSELSLGGKVNTRRMSKPDMESNSQN